MRSFAVIATSVALVFGLTATAYAQSTSTTTTTTVSPDVKSTWEKIKGGWGQTKGAVKEQWGKLTDDDLMEIEGRREKLVGKIQTRYGISKEQAESQVSGWERHYKSM
jgi:uncharacterized protein YjbJ (UPF0337 family)